MSCGSFFGGTGLRSKSGACGIESRFQRWDFFGGAGGFPGRCPGLEMSLRRLRFGPGQEMGLRSARGLVGFCAVSRLNMERGNLEPLVALAEGFCGGGAGVFAICAVFPLNNERGTGTLPTRFPIPDSRFPIPDSRFPIPDSRFPIPRFPQWVSGREPGAAASPYPRLCVRHQTALPAGTPEP